MGTAPRTVKEELRANLLRALNPARAFGPALAANYWYNHGVYWIGPLAGGVAAGWLYDILFLTKE